MSDLGFSLLQNGTMGFSSATDFDRAKNYTDKEITIKSISANGSAIAPDENKNVDIDIKSVVKKSYLFGTGAPTTSTAAEFVGQLYSDTQNIKLYQCTGITESDDGTKTYEWIKVIRDKDVPTEANKEVGVVRVDSIYGITTGWRVAGNVTYEGILQTVHASEYDINNRNNMYRPIVPYNLDYAVRSVRPAASDTAPTTLAINTLYSINNTTSASIELTLPQGQVGDFVQYDFVTGETAPTVTILSSYGMTAFDFTPEAKKIYSLFFDWGIIGNDNTENKYGWRISFAEYDRVVIFPEEDL